MSKSNIIIRTRYKRSLTASKHISKWVDYVSKKEKADATSLDDKNIMNEYFALADKDSFLYEKCESFVWGQDGDINPKQDLPKIDDTGFVWNLVISFPPDFAIKNGLITKSDYYDLTKHIMPSLIVDMGLRLGNTIWYASLHRNTDNPHLHISLIEKNKTATKGFVPQFAIQNMKSNIGNYLIDNTKFYELRDKEFSNITGGISLKELTKDDLVLILTEPKNAITKQFKASFEIDGIQLIFEQDAIEEIANEAIRQKTGARGLRTIVERMLMDVMFEIPDLGEKKSFYISAAGLNKENLKIYLKNFNLKIMGEGIGAPAPKVSWMDAPSLKDAYKDLFDYFGIAVSLKGELNTSDGQIGLERQASSITMGNEMKPDFLFAWKRPNTMCDFVAEDGNTYQVPDNLPIFSDVRMILLMARSLGIQMRGHVLVWHSQTPKWFFKENYSTDANAAYVDKATMTARQEWYIKSVLEHIKDWEDKNNNGERIIYCWDVVNEAADDSGTQLRSASNWYKIYNLFLDLDIYTFLHIVY